MPTTPPTEPRSTFAQVVVVSGHMVDLPDRSSPRFPASDEQAVLEAIQVVLRDWAVGSGTLLVSGGARGTDILAAEQALARGAEAWLLLALPDEEFVAASVDIPGTDWLERFRALRGRCPTWFQFEELGRPTGDEDVFERNNDWCLSVAHAQATTGELRVLAVWDGERGDGRGGTSHLIERARSLGGSVEVIRPPACQ